MAKKNVPLKKPFGSDGQGNIRVPGGPVVLDLGDFDDIFGPMESESPKQGPLGQFYTGLKDSLSDRFKTKDIVRNFLRSAAPDGLSNVMGFADEAMAATRDIKESLERTNAADLQYIAKRAQQILPQVKDYVSEDTYNNISEGLENKIDEYDYTIQSARDQTAIRRARQEESDSNQIKAAMDNIALTDRLNHNKSEHAANARHSQTRAENSIRDVLTTKRFDFMAKSMGMAVDSLQRIAGYNEQVEYGFQRKGLELQFRSYLGIKELVKLNEAQLELNARAYNSIIRNTALADHQKSNRKDLGQMSDGKSGNRGFMSNAARAIGGKTLSQFYGNYSGDVQSRVTDSLSQKLSMAVQALRMGESGPNLWDNKYQFAGGIAGDFLSDFLLNDLVPMVGREARGPLTKLSNKYGGRHNQAGYMMDNMPAFLQEFVNNNQNQHGWKGSIRNLIAPYVPQFGLQDRLQNGTFQTIDQHAAFNQATQRSIVDGIPGYLARILQEMRMIRTGSDQVAREVFDMTTGKFGVEASMHENIQNRILPENAVRSASSTINDALNTMDKEGKLSPEARKALGERMLRDSSSNQRFDPDSYIRARGYANGTSPEVTAELDKFFRGQFEYDDNGKMTDTSSNHQLRQEFSQAFLDIRSISRDPIKEINRMINSGHTEPLRAMGIIITEKGQDRINYPRIWEILRSGVTDHNPYAPGGNGNDPFAEDNSGKVGHKAFVGPQHPGMVRAFAQNKMDAFRTKYAPEEQAARDAMAKHLKAMRGRFGSAAKNVQETFADITNGKGTDYIPGIQGFSKMMSAGPGFGPQNLAGGSAAAINKTLNAIREKAGGTALPLTDLYSSHNNNSHYPSIRTRDFLDGSLIDVNTKKVITKPSDITGKVVNTAGDVILTAAEVAAGLTNANGDMVLKVDNRIQPSVGNAIDKSEPKHNTADSTSEGHDAEEKLNSQDWALGPGENPIITARGLANGEYMDAAGKIIDSIADISSDIYDKTGNLVMTAKEFANGLWSKRTGKRYRPTKGLSKLLNLAKGAARFSGASVSTIGVGALKFAGKAALGVASAAFNFVVENQNAYLPGEPVPVITRRQLQAGEYYDDKGKTIEDFVDVYSPIYNAQGEAVIAPELYKQLKNFDGSKHVLAKNRRIWAKYIMRPMRAFRDAYMRQTKRYYKWLGKTTVKAGGWLGGKLFGGFAKAGGKLLNSMFESVEDPNAKAQIDATLMAGQQQTAVMEQVLHAIQDLKPKELRKGSWQEQAARKAGLGGAATKTDGKESDEKQAGFLKRGLAGLASMLGLGGDDDDDDGFGLDDAADIADIGDSVGNARDRGRRRRRGRRGRLGRLWDKAKGSKLGRWGGSLMEKAGQSRLGQMATRGVAAAGNTALGRAGLSVVTQVAKRPTLWTAIAAASVGMGAYLYSSFKDSSGEFRRLRLAQYGIRGMRRELKVLELESLLEKYTDKNSDQPSFSLNGAGAKELLGIMGIDLDNQAEVLNFAKWLELRFKPIYLAWIGGLNKIGQSQVKINEIDDNVPKELKADLLEAVKFPYNGDTPYDVLVNPFDPDDTPEPNAEYISKMFDELKAKYDPERKAADAKDDKKDDGKGKPDKAAGGTATATELAAMATGNMAKDLAKTLAETNDKNANVLKTGIAATAATASSMSGTIANLNERIGNAITGLQAIRMRAYGVQTLHLADVRSLLSLEAVYAKDLTVTEGVVDYDGDESKLLAAAGALLGKDTSVGSNDRPKLYNWLVQRFGPSFRAYYGTAKGLNPSADLKSMETKLSGADKVTVGQAVMGAVYRHDQTVWESDSIFDVKGPLSDLKRLADADLEQLRKDSAKEVIDSPTQKGSDQMAGKNAAETGGSFADKVVGTIKDTWNKTTETVSNAWNRASDAAQDTYAGAKIAIGMGPEYGEGGASGGQIKSTGTGGTMLSGTGGKFEELPYPSANGSIKAAYPTLLAAGKMTGVPVDWLTVIAGIESNFNYEIQASTSSATGWYQFIDSTWDQVVKQYGAKYGIPGKQADPDRRARKDPRASALMGGEFIKSNYDIVSKGIGRKDLTDTDIYMAHFLGPGGAIKFLKADPNAMAYKIFSKEYSANMSIFFVKGKPSQPRTISEVYKLFQAKMDNFWNTVGKGYRQGTGDSTDNPNADAQTPGAVENSQTADEAAMRDKLKAEAANKDGMGSDTEADPTSDSKIEQGGGTGSVQSLARNTAPMPGAPASGGGSSTSVSSTGTDSGAGTADSQQQAQMDAAQAQNTRRAAEVKRDQAVAADVNDVQVRQLNTLFEIRDLTQLQLDNSRDLLAAFTSGQSAGGQGSGNNMNPSTMQGRPAAQRQSSVTLR